MKTIKYITLSIVVLSFCFSAMHSTAQPDPQELKQQPYLNIYDFGAKGDGKTDDTAAFEKALATAKELGGTSILLPRGNYLIEGCLDIPKHVVLKGVFEAPTARTQNKGTTLLAVAGAGNADGTPFITLHDNATLKGLTIFYPNQIKSKNPTPYPWTVRGIGDNCSIVDVLMVNPYQAVDFGTYPAGRHYIKNLYAQAIYKGIFVDQCYDIGRIEDVHLWPFWGWENGLHDFMLENATAYIFGRTDWEYVQNCFCIGYSVGFHFIPTKAGTPNVLLTQSGSDVGPVAVKVDAVMPHAGVSFSNCQMMATVLVSGNNQGPVKFTSCGFWGIESTNEHAVIEGSGTVSFTACHFNNWGRKDPNAPAIRAKEGSLIVNGCEFMEDKPQIQLDEKVTSAIIFGNRFQHGQKIENNSKGQVEIGFNTTQ